MATEAGVKHDHGKPRASLVVHGFARALLEVSAVATFGAEKYTANGWMSVPNGLDRYTDAMYRHLLAEAAGQQCDAESGLVHAAHAAWCALARLELMLRDEEAWRGGIKSEEGMCYEQRADGRGPSPDDE